MVMAGLPDSGNTESRNLISGDEVGELVEVTGLGFSQPDRQINTELSNDEVQASMGLLNLSSTADSLSPPLAQSGLRRTFAIDETEESAGNSYLRSQSLAVRNTLARPETAPASNFESLIFHA